MSTIPSRKENSPTLVAKYASIIKGKTIITTGASPTSVGGTFAVCVAAASPALLILAGRNTAKLQQTADTIAAAHPSVPVRLLKLDLASLEGPRKAAEEVNSWADVPKIDVLVNNAGIMAVDYALSPEGIESQFMSNHLAHFLFTNLIMDKILASEAPRVVNVTSDGHRLGHMRWDDLNYDVSPHITCSIVSTSALTHYVSQGGKTYERWNAYGQSKTANMLMVLSLAEKLGKRGLLAYSLHPGLIMATSLASHLDPETGVPGLRKCFS